MTSEVMLRVCEGIEEIPELLELWRRSKETGRDLMSASDVDWLAYVLEVTYGGSAQIIIAERATDPLGFMVLLENRVLLLWVRADTRGSGAGERLLHWALAKHRDLQVDVHINNRDGIAFYRQYGFQACSGDETTTHQDSQRRWLCHQGARIES